MKALNINLFIRRYSTTFNTCCNVFSLSKICKLLGYFQKSLIEKFHSGENSLQDISINYIHGCDDSLKKKKFSYLCYQLTVRYIINYCSIYLYEEV